MDAELILDAKALLGEGPVWDESTGRLYWVDIEGHALHVFNPDRGTDRSIATGEYIGCAGLCPDGKLIAGLKHRFAFIDPVDGSIRTAAERGELPDSRFNDGKPGPDGCFWAGTISLVKNAGGEKLYTLERDRRIVERAGGITTSNGLDWSADERTLYYIDTPTKTVVAYDFDRDSGALADKRIVIEFGDDEGRPDGMCADADGMLWIAHWAGGRITRRDPKNGAILETIALPVTYVTSCCFGGPKLTELYITTARKPVAMEKIDREPHAGGVFVCHIKNTAGKPAYRFLG